MKKLSKKTIITIIASVFILLVGIIIGLMLSRNPLSSTESTQEPVEDSTTIEEDESKKEQESEDTTTEQDIESQKQDQKKQNAMYAKTLLVNAMGTSDWDGTVEYDENQHALLVTFDSTFIERFMSDQVSFQELVGLEESYQTLSETLSRVSNEPTLKLIVQHPAYDENSDIEPAFIIVNGQSEYSMLNHLIIE